ncbi:uncharacterized protein A4U43_C07F10420 [Asparagus officinalis]|uniref:Uncharacterized protein n=1 Tax=Asparagus officinalis TaxID=4686 RepID=A0A5P1ECS2_ASPOF|nr:uncharacterized protein A4U43_C07F10420 [Asparagus officinalis]
MATSIPIQTIQNPLLNKTQLLHKTHLSAPSSSSHRLIFTPHAKFNLSEIMGGRGLCNGEAGLQKELKRQIQQDPSTGSQSQPTPPSPTPSSSFDDNDAFEKELMGLTGGFPGGEKGLEKFIQENPPPKKSSANEEAESY